ncbi:hypothetical protein hairong_133 [Pseudomonas phage hairong]|nr:hypothetical protein hairong_133 [Pseudomonas phage hairong]
MEEIVRRWIKFNMIPGWQQHWDPSRVFDLEDKPDVPHIIPSIRLAANGHPAARKDGKEITIAGVWLPGIGILRTLTFHSSRDDCLYEIRDCAHQYGVCRTSDKLDRARFSNDLEEILSEFIVDMPMTVQHPFRHIKDEPVPVPTHKPEGFGKWA